MQFLYNKDAKIRPYVAYNERFNALLVKQKASFVKRDFFLHGSRSNSLSFFSLIPELISL
jgi:hypothetical protein